LHFVATRTISAYADLRPHARASYAVPAASAGSRCHDRKGA
jgi:hypothetical protein